MRVLKVTLEDSHYKFIYDKAKQSNACRNQVIKKIIDNQLFLEEFLKKQSSDNQKYLGSK